MKSSDIRQAFLDYFKEQGHTIVPSSPLVPGNDPTLLFTNAGMVQFKDVFLGVDKRSYNKAASSQRCVRAGGKHNDLENVGYTARHHTFFEMLGNFSFGDYFKKPAIEFAWQFLTKNLKIPAEKLWVTVYEEDQEAADIWLKELKIDPKRFSRCGAKDNFWSMGDTGPCGPCTEIFYDHGAEIPGGPPGSPDADGDRYIEIWNLVFMQFDRNFAGELTPLPKPSVDTGMGLERISAVMQGVHNNYDTDLFQPIIKKTAQLANMADLKNTSLRVIADHIRSCAFLIADGVLPANEGRGYVLRRIIRRAIRHGSKLGLKDAFFYQLVAPLAEIMGTAYPDLKQKQTTIERTLKQEELQFAKTLETGLKLLEQDLQGLKDKIIPGSTIFKLYDTYGFPVDLTADIARERGFEIDAEGFEKEMSKQREKSQAASKFGVDYSQRLAVEGTTDFSYEDLALEGKIIALFCDNAPADSLQTEIESIVVLDKTPFYAEAGGQIGDQGWLYGSSGQFQVTDTRKEGQVYLHYGILKQGTLQIGDKVRAEVDQDKRTATALNHSATHLLHAALRKILGEHVMQKGSLVAPDRLRFDFTQPTPLTFPQIKAVEELVNQQIRKNYPVKTHLMTPEEATQQGALALFGEKYGEQVRVLEMGNFSKELCGGTHVSRTGDIGFLKITLETGIAAGVRRIEAVTGEAALQWVFGLEGQITEIGNALKTNKDGLIEKIKRNLQHTQKLEKQIEQLQNRLANAAGNDLMSQAVNINGIKLLSAEIDNVETKELRNAVDQFKDKLGSAVVVLGSVNDTNRVQLVAGVTKDVVSKISANDLIAQLAVHINGKGGGRADFAQAGGSNPQGLATALETAKKIIQEVFKK